MARLRLLKKVVLEIELFSRPGKSHWVPDLIEAQQGGEWEELVKIWSTTQVLAAVEVEVEEGEEEVVVDNRNSLLRLLSPTQKQRQVVVSQRKRQPANKLQRGCGE